MNTTKTILCFGDSNTWGYIPGSAQRYAYQSRWTGCLQKALGRGYRVLEEGLNGRTTVWDEPFREGRNGRRLLRPLLESHAPVDLLIIALGTNDLKHFYQATAFDSARGVQTLVTIARSSVTGPEGKAPMVLIIAPPVMTTLSEAMFRQFQGAREKSSGFSEAFSEVARLENCYFVDASQVLECSSVDGIHFDAEAHQNLAFALEKKIREIFALESVKNG
ncbi:MAG: SGNH/GDSL hydrolase family protein [Gammaproteobacteria bacterium]